MSNEMNSYVALLRGINLGGKTILPMKELAPMFSAMGCAAVKTYIQSGNVLFRSTSSTAARIPTEIPALIEQRFSFRPPVVLRAAKALSEVAQQNPFLQRGEDASALHVMFLSALPEVSKVALLEPSRFAPDEFVVLGQEVYLFYPNGMGKSKLGINYFEKKLSVVATARNWNTTLKLISLSEL
jgi:uncharacterized protein (DUF1697 family)